MPTYAHTETGQALDPIERVDEAAYRKLFHPDSMKYRDENGELKPWNVAEVPDRSQHNDKIVLADGAYINPTLVKRDEVEAARVAAEAAKALALEISEGE